MTLVNLGDNSAVQRAATVLFILGVILTLAGMAALLYLAFFAHLPARPDVASGYLIELDVPGAVRSTRYMTPAQAWLSERLPLIGLAIGFVAVALRRLSGSRRRRPHRGA